MREELKRLVQLQGLDSTVQELKKTKQKLSKDAEAADKAAASAQQQLTNRTEEAKSFRRAIDQREGDLKEMEGRIIKLETQLNTVKTNKEYSALQNEILGLKADKSRIEDDILKMMDQVEQQQKDVKSASTKADEAVAQAAQKQQAIKTAIEDADARIERIKGERAQLVEQIPPSYLMPYERLLTKADGRAMVPCRNYVCGGCRMSLTANTVNLLMTGEKLIFCQSCGRILYLADDEDLTNIAIAGRRE